MDAILTAGAKLANLAFNLSQSSALRAEVRGSLDECRREWDAAVRAQEAPAGASVGNGVHAAIGELVAQFSALPVLWGLNEPGALVRHGDVFKLLIDASKAATAPPAGLAFTSGKPMSACWCAPCRPVTMLESRMVLCPICGNKRCPRANDHRHDCTGSNEPGQPGSAYPVTASNLETPP